MNHAASIKFFALIVTALSLVSRRVVEAQSTYSASIVIGDGYSDDGRMPFKIQRRSVSVTEFPKAWPDRFVEELSPTQLTPLFDYAQSGAHPSNQLSNHNSNIPDTQAQIDKYHNDIVNRQIAAGPGRILFFYWVGVSAIDKIWRDACEFQPEGATQPSDEAGSPLNRAFQAIDQQIEVVRGQVNFMRTDAVMQQFSNALVVMTVPPHETSPMAVDLSEKWAKNDTTIASRYRNTLQTLVNRYNDGLGKIVKTYSNATAENDAGFVKLFETQTVWSKVLSNPTQYGLQNVQDACFNCSTPNAYFYKDVLYPSSRVHAIIADEMVQFVNSVKTGKSN